jgi:chemotaxis protein MotB
VIKLSDLRKHRPEEEDLWPISLADMMTLLLCFFLLIVAVSQVDINRYDRVADSMEKAMIPSPPASRKKPAPPATPAVPPQKVASPELTVRSKVNRTTLSSETAPIPEAEKPKEPEVKPTPAKTETTPPPEERTGPTKKSLEDIRKELASKLGITNGAVEVMPRENGVELSLRGAAFFDLASADIKTGGVPLLRDIAATLAGTPYKVTVEGHTDNLPIESWLYPSNWELSSARASRVARFLIDHGVPKDRMRVGGLADTQPVAPNTDPAGRSIPENQAKNRRVVILVSP